MSRTVPSLASVPRRLRTLPPVILNVASALLTSEPEMSPPDQLAWPVFSSQPEPPTDPPAISKLPSMAQVATAPVAVDRAPALTRTVPAPS